MSLPRSQSRKSSIPKWLLKIFFYECKNIFIMRLYLSCDIATWFSHDRNENFWLMKVKFRSTQYDVLNGCEQNLEIMIYSFFIILSFLYFQSWINIWIIPMEDHLQLWYFWRIFNESSDTRMTAIFE